MVKSKHDLEDELSDARRRIHELEARIERMRDEAENRYPGSPKETKELIEKALNLIPYEKFSLRAWFQKHGFISPRELF